MKGDTHKRKGKSAFDLAQYLFRELAKAKLLLSNIGSTAQVIARELSMLSGLQPDSENVFLHITLSPHKQDQISTVEWNQMARSAVDKMQLPPGWPRVVFKHSYRNNRPEPHLHIVFPLVGDDGSRLTNPPSPFQVMQIAAELENEFNLIKTPGIIKKNH
jgi:hypothetical protein